MTNSGDQVLTPPATWAQRKNLVYLNIILEDSKNPTLKIEKDRLIFKGKGGPDQKDHELNIELFGNVNPDESKYIVRARGTEIVLIKENLDAPFWTRLTKDNTKKHWLKVDFSKWKDEDDDDEPEEGGPPPGAGGPPGGGDFEEMMRQMGGLGGAGGMPDFGGGGADFGDLDGGEDSDDDELPDLEEAKDEKPQ